MKQQATDYIMISFSDLPIVAGLWHIGHNIRAEKSSTNTQAKLKKNVTSGRCVRNMICQKYDNESKIYELADLPVSATILSQMCSNVNRILGIFVIFF
jgi:hypothetical protein